MLVTLKEIFKIAEEKEIAVGAFNATGLESILAIISAAEELDLPVILQCAQVHETLIPIATVGPIALDFAKKAKVPVCVHLDHGESFDYLEKALKLGFTSIMYDGSVLPYEENVANTKKAVALAKKYGATVEAELGSMGRRSTGEAGDGSGVGDETKIYTDADQAKKFIAETGIDALACSFGTTHGIYLTKPKLDFSVITNVRKATNNIPIVMHGGSGVSKEDFHKCIKAGVRKINYFTYMDKAGGTAAAEYIKTLKENEPVFFSNIVTAATAGIKANVKEAMMTFALMD